MIGMIDSESGAFNEPVQKSFCTSMIKRQRLIGLEDDEEEEGGDDGNWDAEAEAEARADGENEKAFSESVIAIDEAYDVQIDEMIGWLLKVGGVDGLDRIELSQTELNCLKLD